MLHKLTVFFCLLYNIHFSPYAIADSPTYGENLPLNWYTMPEDLTNEERDSWTYGYTDLNPRQEQGLDRVIHANALALDKMEKRFPSDERAQWRMDACMLDLAVSVGGVVGALVAKGDASAALYFRKRHDREAKRHDFAVDTSDLSFDAEDSFDDLDARIEPLVKAIMATGQIEDESALRKNLSEQVFDIHTIVQFITHQPNTRWNASRLRVDLEVTVTGKVNPVTAVGGSVRIRLEWLKSGKRNPALARVPARFLERNRKTGEGLKKIAENLVQQMQEVKYSDLQSEGFELKSVRLGLALFGEGHVGVLKVGGRLFGFLYLTPNVRYQEDSTPRWSERYAYVPLVDYTNNLHWEKWANSHQIPFQAFNDGRGTQANVYETPAQEMRKGLEKAVRMGSRMAARSKKAGGSWEIYTVKAEFQFSLSGDAGLFKLGSTGSLQVVFSN